MKIDKQFTVSVPIERAWSVLTDLEGIAPCLPGAQLTGVEDDVYSGKVKVKVGPVISEYAGTAQFLEKDDTTYRALIDAKGKDSRGAGNASAMISARLEAQGARTTVIVDVDLKISGKIAQFGSGMITEVSEKLFAQFADNLEAKLAATVPAAVPSTAAADTGTAAPAAVVPSAEPGSTARAIVPPAEPEPLDFMSIAGRSIVKRALPIVAVVLIVIGVVIYRAVK